MPSPHSIFHMVGNAHLDPAWMWTWEEGMEAFISTCRSALERLRETPSFVFTCSSAMHYRWVEMVDPDLFARIRECVEQGSWVIAGGWWTQADCNLPSTEGFVRQSLLGQRYFMEHFGRIARTGYSPDAFGHARGLPQILARSGMTYYVYCRPDPTERHLPSPLLRWRSQNGSEVLAYRIPYHYNMYENSVPKKIADLEQALVDAGPLAADAPGLNTFSHEWMLFYGVGNHGGGPTRQHIADIIAINARPETPQLLFSSPDAYFRSIEQQHDIIIPEWNTDLQMNAPGCYSAAAQIKRLNRQAEQMLSTAEALAVLASVLTTTPYPTAPMRDAWRNVCFNHFHDILCGVAIREALDDATHLYGESLAIASRTERMSVQRIAQRIDTTGEGQALIVFNPHAHAVEGNVRFELWHDIDKSLWQTPVAISVSDNSGSEILSQTGFSSGKIGRDRIAVTFPAEIPPLGWRLFRVHYGRAAADTASFHSSICDHLLENSYMRIEFSRESGSISRIFDKGMGRDLLAEQGSQLVAIDDPTDTWGHGVTRFDNVIGMFGDAELSLVENGPTHATIRSISRWRRSWIRQEFTLRRTARTIDVVATLFWGEERVMLKLTTATILAETLHTMEVAGGTITHPADGSERATGTWSALLGRVGDICSGIAVVTDTKHASSANNADLSITLLRSPPYAHHDPHPFSPHETLDYMDQGIDRFTYRIVPLPPDEIEKGIWPATLTQMGRLLNAHLIPHLESAHKAHGVPMAFSGIKVEPESVIVTALKRGEDSDAWIVRLYEASGKACSATVTMPLLDAAWSIEMQPHDLRTFRIDDGVTEVDLVERDVSN